MFNGLAKLLSVGFIDSIDRHSERGSANSSKPCADPRDEDTVVAFIILFFTFFYLGHSL